MAPAESPPSPGKAAGWADLRQRFLTALVVGPPILLALYVGTWPFAAVMIVCGSIVFFEWDRMTRQGPADAALWLGMATIAAAGIVAALLLPWSAFLALAAGCLVMAGVRFGIRSIGWMAGGLVYGGLPVIGLVVLRQIPEAGILAVGWALTTVWASDIGAYAAGRAIGGAKLIPAISPNKTWSGAIGGIVAAIAWSLGYYAVFGFTWIAGPILTSIIASVTGQGGDLFESWLKRRFGVKDSGTLFPGHGGIMDRADAVILSTAVICVLNVAGVIFVAVGGAQP